MHYEEFKFVISEYEDGFTAGFTDSENRTFGSFGATEGEAIDKACKFFKDRRIILELKAQENKLP